MTFKRTSTFLTHKAQSESPNKASSDRGNKKEVNEEIVDKKNIPQASLHDPEVLPKEDHQEVPSFAQAKPSKNKSSRFVRIAQADNAQTTPAVSQMMDEPQWEAWNINPTLFKPLDHFEQSVCPKCQHQTLLVDTHSTSTSKGLFLCLYCHFTGNARQAPKTFRGSFVASWQTYLENAVHDKKSWMKENLSTLQQESLNALPVFLAYAIEPTHTPQTKDNLSLCLHVPSFDDKHQLRDCHILSKQVQWFRYDLPAFPLHWENIQSNERLVLTQNAFDLGGLLHSGLKNVASLPPDMDTTLTQSNAWKVLEFMEDKLSPSSDVVFVFPKTYSSLEEELARRMGKERCFRVRWENLSNGYEDPLEEKGLEEKELEQSQEIDEKTKKDISSVSQALDTFGASFVQTMVDVASPFPVSGLHELADLDDRFEELYSTGLTPGAETGWPSMDVRYTVKTGQWTLVTGIPGHGKSSWLDALLVNLATLHGWRFGLFSPENQPMERHFASLMEKKIGKPFSKGPTPRISIEEKNNCKRWLNDKFKIILPDEDDGLWTLEAVLNLAKTLVYRYGIRGLVIDPWNELDHARQSHVSETTYISECLTKIRRFARLYDIHIWIIAHPTKLEKRSDGKYPVATPYDVSGGAHWRNKADVAISVYRNVDEADYDISDIYVQKIRFREVGSLGVTSLRSDVASGAYIDDIDQSKREYSLRSGTYAPSSSMRLASPRQYSKTKIPVTNTPDF